MAEEGAQLKTSSTYNCFGTIHPTIQQNSKFQTFFGLRGHLKSSQVSYSDTTLQAHKNDK